MPARKAQPAPKKPIGGPGWRKYSRRQGEAALRELLGFRTVRSIDIPELVALRSGLLLSDKDREHFADAEDNAISFLAIASRRMILRLLDQQLGKLGGELHAQIIRASVQLQVTQAAARRSPFRSTLTVPAVFHR